MTLDCGKSYHTPRIEGGHVHTAPGFPLAVAELSGSRRRAVTGVRRWMLTNTRALSPFGRYSSCST